MQISFDTKSKNSVLVRVFPYPQSRLCLAEESIYLDKISKTLYILPGIELCPLLVDLKRSLIFCQVDIELPHLKRMFLINGQLQNKSYETVTKIEFACTERGARVRKIQTNKNKQADGVGQHFSWLVARTKERTEQCSQP